jgi:PTS system N-acetylgalactosamine-specific IIA component
MADGTTRAIVAGHGDFASGLVSAVAQITGLGALFEAMSNRDLGADEIERRLRERVEATGALVIFTDLPSGSATIAARRVLKGRGDLALVTGANLAALLDFAFHAEAAPHEAARRAVEKGRASMAAVGAPGGH